MNDLKRRQIGWKAAGTLLAIVTILTLSVGSTLWMVEAQTGRMGVLHQFLLGLEIVGLLVIGVMVYALYTRVLRPLEMLTQEAAAVADGDLDRTITAVDRDDEIGSLTRSVRAMRDRLLELFEEAKVFERAVEEASHSVVITDRDETIQYVNPAFEQISGYPKSVALGRTPRILKSGETDEEVYREMWADLQNGDTWRGELVNQRKTGERWYAQQTITPIENDAGSIEHFVSIGVDVTHRKLRNQVLEVYNRVLRHNLRNRLNVVTGNAEIVGKRHAKALQTLVGDIESLGDGEQLHQASEPSKKPDEIAAELDEIAESVREHATTIVDSGSRLAAVNEKAGKADRITQFTDKNQQHNPLSHHIREETDALRATHPGAEVTVSLPSSETIPCKQSMRTAIGELLDNAVEHNDTDTPRIEISMAVTAGRVEVSIADNGPGIPEHERAVLREGEETPLAHGSGLGLWLVYWIVTMNGGRLQIHDNEPRGTVVEIDLPLPRTENGPGGLTETVAGDD